VLIESFAEVYINSTYNIKQSDTDNDILRVRNAAMSSFILFIIIFCLLLVLTFVAGLGFYLLFSVFCFFLSVTVTEALILVRCGTMQIILEALRLCAI